MRKAKLMIDDNNKVHYVPTVPVTTKVKNTALVTGIKTVSAFHYLKRGVANVTTQTVTTVKDAPKAVVGVGTSLRDTVRIAKVRRAGRKSLYEQAGRATVTVGDAKTKKAAESTAA